MLKFLALTFLLATANATFFRSCNIPGVITPDNVESPFCGVDRCTMTRGDTLVADVWATPVRAHQRLILSVVAFVAGIGIPVSNLSI